MNCTWIGLRFLAHSKTGDVVWSQRDLGSSRKESLGRENGCTITSLIPLRTVCFRRIGKADRLSLRPGCSSALVFCPEQISSAHSYGPARAAKVPVCLDLRSSE